jgi:hypothetical protein
VARVQVQCGDGGGVRDGTNVAVSERIVGWWIIVDGDDDILNYGWKLSRQRRLDR